MATIYRCGCCGLSFSEKEECILHIEQEHKVEDPELHVLIISGLTEEEKRELLAREEIELETLQGLPKKEVEESYPYYYGYPYYYSPTGYPIVPQHYYYRYPPPPDYIPTPIKGIFRKGNIFYCAIHGKRFNNLKTLLEHLKKMHSKEDYILGLKMAIREKYYYLAKLQGRHISEEELKRISDQELLARVFREYFTKPEEVQRLGQLVDSRLEDLKRFFKNETSICPLCHQQLLEIDETLLSGFNIPKGVDKYVSRITFLGESIRVDLRRLIHLGSKHPVTFQSLVKNGLLSGKGVETLIKNLANREKTPKERAKETLMKKWIESKDRTTTTPKLDKKTQMWLWLNKDRHEKERTYSKDD